MNDIHATIFFFVICFFLFDLPMFSFVVDVLFLDCLQELSQLHIAAFHKSFYESLDDSSYDSLDESFHESLVTL